MGECSGLSAQYFRMSACPRQICCLSSSYISRHKLAGWERTLGHLILKGAVTQRSTSHGPTYCEYHKPLYSIRGAFFSRSVISKLSLCRLSELSWIFSSVSPFSPYISLTLFKDHQDS